MRRTRRQGADKVAPLAAALLLLGAVTADAQVMLPGPPWLHAISDLDGPYAAMPPPPARYGYGPSLLPPQEVYTVLRETGFSPLGVPRLRGEVYTIAAVDPRGVDGRLVIDAREGRILRFVPAPDMRPPYGYRGGVYGLPPLIQGGLPRPPAAIPHLYSRSVPLPRPAPRHSTVAAARTEPAALSGPPVAPAPQQATAAAGQPNAPAPALSIGQAPPASPAGAPGQAMPPVQALE